MLQRNGSEFGASNIILLVSQVKSRSKMLPDLCVQKPTFWSKPRASIASKSCLALSLSGSLICILKSPCTIRFVLLSESSSVVRVSINSVMNCPMVCWNLSDRGGWCVVFDATKYFFHLPLNEKSKLLTAMLTPIRVYVFNVLAMGLSISNDLFESALRELLQGLKGMFNSTDDILVLNPPNKSRIVMW